MREPKVRKDGKCAVCRKPRKMPAGAMYRASAKLDPFCSRGCCEAWYEEKRAKEAAA